jgi:indole-3-glycerol phosphate synthase
MPSRLAEILAVKKKEIENLKNKGFSRSGTVAPLPIRDFKDALSTPDQTALIAEIKFASPSAGVIREREDPRTFACVYATAGARAISLVTDERFFGGNLGDLLPVKKAVPIPVLRKDFILDEIQVEESFQHGADALLLIARCLSGKKMRQMLDLCRKRGMAALTEVHSKPELFKALDSGADIIGINNRDLRTFEVHLQTILNIAASIPKGTILVSESGISTSQDIHLLRGMGVQAVLVGTVLMRSLDPQAKARELVVAGQAHD